VQFFQKAAPLDVSVLDPAFEFLNAVFHPLNRFTDFGIEGNGKAVLFLGGNPVVFVGVIVMLYRFPAAALVVAHSGFCKADVVGLVLDELATVFSPHPVGTI
jgi:hypothetical protein